METDLGNIKAIAQQKEEENYAFRAYLKGSDYSDKEIDTRVHDLLHEIKPQISCQECRNCCKRLKPNITQEELDRVTVELGVTTDQLRDAYLVPDTTEGGWTVAGLPCPFLVDNQCSLNETRPIGCQTFPYLEKDDFTRRLLGVVEFYAICPIVFNVYERLKDSLGWSWNPKGRSSREGVSWSRHQLGQRTKLNRRTNPQPKYKYRRLPKT